MANITYESAIGKRGCRAMAQCTGGVSHDVNRYVSHNYIQPDIVKTATTWTTTASVLVEQY